MSGIIPWKLGPIPDHNGSHRSRNPIPQVLVTVDRSPFLTFCRGPLSNIGATEFDSDIHSRPFLTTEKRSDGRCRVIIIATFPYCSLRSPSPIYISLDIDPKPFEGFVHLPAHPQLIDFYRRVAVFRDVVFYPERLCRPGIFLTVRHSAGERRTEREF